jgi:hypothetical protein
MKNACLFSVICLLATGVVGAVPSTLAESPGPAAAVATKKQAALGVLDRQIALFDQLAAAISDREEKASVKAILDGFKDRRAALRSIFENDTYLELRWEIDVEYQRLQAWLKGETEPPVPPRGRG